ncbi:A24 family peptidase [uncultured Tyzzerella sp.]|uniref:prepilin peptidase n=1 Tax=uncultured Tyzzerella sp. TaxID=2321398 RepID=UPI002942EEB8|nr:A24 family peptidase [uncultured Tyzzerella sp.]
MLIFFIYSILIGFLSNFIIYAYCQDKLAFKNFYCLKALSNKILSFSIVILNFITSFLIYKNLGISIYSYLCFIVSSLLICLSVIDIKTGIVPDTINLLIFFMAIVAIILTKYNILYHIIGFFLISGPFLFISVLTNGIGGGDIKLFAVTGLFLGAIHIFLAMFICCILASVIGIILKYSNKTTKLYNGNSIPLVPYISIGVFITILYGENILNWYFSTFFI